MLGVFHQAAAQENVIRIATFDNPPYVGENIAKHGFLAQITAESFKEAGYSAKFSFFPFKHSFMSVRRGYLDAMMTLWYRPKREEWFAFSNTINTNEIGFYALKKRKISYSKLEELKGLSVG